MNTYISLLRGINVSGQKQIRMTDLKDLYQSLGFTHAESYLQSGNLVFTSDEEDRSIIAEAIEAAIARTLGYEVIVIMRDADDFRRIVQSNPFLTTRNEDPSYLHVTFLTEPPSPAALSTLVVPGDAPDEFHVVGQEVYLFCPNGYGRTKLSNQFFERKLNVAATTRNWKTVTALYNMTTDRVGGATY